MRPLAFLLMLLTSSPALAARWRGQLCTDAGCAPLVLRGRFIGSDFALGHFRCRGAVCPLRRGAWSVGWVPDHAFGNLYRGAAACDWGSDVTAAPDFVDGGFSCHDGRTGTLSLTRVR